jgi:formyltetrahydrofolate hydrolase
MSIKLLIACPDQKGIVYEVTKFVFENGGNIIDSQQHSLGLILILAI